MKGIVTGCCRQPGGAESLIYGARRSTKPVWPSASLTQPSQTRGGKQAVVLAPGAFQDDLAYPFHLCPFVFICVSNTCSASFTRSPAGGDIRPPAAWTPLEKLIAYAARRSTK